MFVTTWKSLKYPSLERQFLVYPNLKGLLVIVLHLSVLLFLYFKTNIDFSDV